MKKLFFLFLVYSIFATFTYADDNSSVPVQISASTITAEPEPVTSPAFSFQGLTWGMSQNEVKKVLGNKKIKIDNSAIITKKDNILNMNCKISLYFEKNKLKTIFIAFATTSPYIDFDKLIKTLVIKYGEPLSVDRSIMFATWGSSLPTGIILDYNKKAKVLVLTYDEPLTSEEQKQNETEENNEKQKALEKL